MAVMVCGTWNAGYAQSSLQTLHNHVRGAVSSRQAAMTGSLSADQNMNLTIVLPLRNQSELTSLLKRLYDPSSPDYRHFLSVEQFTEQFGPTAEDYQAVVDFAQASGFTVTAAPQNRLIVPISGTVAQINAAFNLRMSVFQHPTEERTFFSPDREPSLNLSVPVAHIAGLNNFSIPRPMISQAQEGQVIPNVSGSGPGGSYLGSDMRAAYYGGTALTGNGQAVGILEFGGYNPSNVTATFSNAGQTYGVPINNVLVDGATGGPVGDDAEQVLDIVQAIGMAPGLSQVRVYIGVGVGTAIDDANIFNEMATENIAKQLSVSWGWIPDDPETDDVFFQEFAAQGQSIFVASGDFGAFDEAISPYFYPAEDSYVTSVGGTHLTTNGASGLWASETAWNSEQSGSGGGISPDRIAVPSWQTGVANSSNGGSATLRNEPDVAMEGDYDNYNCSIQYGCVGNQAGTSFAAPRWAGFMALVNQQAVEAGTAPLGGVGFLNPAIYPIGMGSSYDSDFHDITIGNNDTENQPVWFSAVTGYDLVTGWGSPAGQSLIDALAGPQTPGFWIEASSGVLSVNKGASSSTTVTVTDAGGFSGSVDLAITSALPTGVTATWGTNPTSGTSTLTLTASSSAPSATANIDLKGISGSLTATTSLAVAVHGPSFLLSASPSSLAVSQGSSGTSTITVTPKFGFTGSVNLAVTSALPTGVTATWGTNPTSGTSVLTLTASNSATAGTATVTITGTSGTLTATTTLSLAVQAPSFTLWAGSQDIGLGSSGTSWVNIYSQYGFSGSVDLSVSGLPSGVTASWSQNPATSSSTLTLTASSTASPGQYTVTITGTSGNLTATTTFTLGVHAPTFTLDAGSYQSIIGLGSSGTDFIYVEGQYGFSGSVTLSVSGLPAGVTASFSLNPTTFSTNMTLNVSSSASIGSYTLTITGTSGSTTATTTVPLQIMAPTFTLWDSGVNIGQGTSTTTYVNVNPLYGFIGSVNLAVTSGLPSGVTASFAPNPTTGSSSLTLTASSTATLGQHTLTITGTSGSLTETTTLVLGVYAPSFTLSDYGNVILGQGSSTTSYVYVTPQYGFSGNVNLAVTSGLPSGVTASFSPNPATGTSMLTLTASSTATLGQYTLTITGTSGLLTATTTVALGVYVPSFTLSDYSSVILGQGSSTTSYVYVNPQNGFSGNVNLAVSGLPSGVTASFSPNPTTGYSMLTLTASSTARLGQYTATITGTSGSLSATTTLSLGVYAPNFTLSASSLNIGQGSSGTSWVYVSPQYGFTGSVNLAVSGLPSGVTASFSPNPATGSSTLTLTASSTASRGQYTATITGTSGSLSATTTVVLGVYAPSFTLSDYGNVVLGQGSSTTSYVYVNPQNGFSGNVNLALTSGLPSGVTASFSPNPTTGSSILTLTASSSASLGQYTLTITGTSGSLTATTTLSLSVFVQSFQLSADSPVIPQGGSGTSSVYVNPQYGFTGSVNLAVSGLPSGVTASFSPTPTTGSSILTLTASSTASLGQYMITITGTSGSLTKSTSVPLTVNPPSFSLPNLPTYLSIRQNSAGTSTITITPIGSFTGSVTLSATGLASGVTASWSPNPTTGTSVLTLTASSSANIGYSFITITGTSGSQTASTNLAVNVIATTTVSTTTALSITPNGGTLTAGESYMLTASVAPASGSAIPTGNVVFTIDSATQAVALNSSGIATISGTAPATAGTLTLSAVYQGSSAFSTSTSNTVSVAVASSAKTTPAITWAQPAAITYGTALSAAQLDASSTVAGTFVYSPSAGAVLNAVPQTLTVTFTPTDSTKYTTATASVTLTVNKATPAVTVTGTAVTVAAGATTGNTSSITVTPSGGFTGSVTLTAAVTSSPANAQYAPTLSFGSTSPVSIAGAATGTATLTISTTAATSATLGSPKRGAIPWYATGGATLACLLLFGIPARRRSWRTMLGMLALLASFACGAVACGSGGSAGGGGGTGHAGTTAGTYTVTVTATSGNITAQGPITLTVP
jgi:subtilase family serine protease